VLLTREKLAALADAGLCHVQISFQGNEPIVADRVAGLKNAHAKKLEVAKWTRELDLPLTVNAVMHRQNLFQLPTSSRWRSISTPTGSKSPMCSITAGR
jgi:pyrroloquinoline quinone biosynthesis protein E